MAVQIKSLKSVKKVENLDPPRTLIYGPPKKGKTTLASEWPNSIFIQAEQGTPGGLVLDSFGDIESYENVMECIEALAAGDHDYKNVVIDSADVLERLIWAKVCQKHKVPTIDLVLKGFGKGYTEATYLWEEVLKGRHEKGVLKQPGLQYLVDKLGMSVTIIAHSEVVKFDDPNSKTYNKWEIRLQKQALGIVQDWVDLILHLDTAVGEVHDAIGFSKKNKRTRATGGSQRWLTTDGSASTTAGNRYKGMPKRIPYFEGRGFETLAKFIPHYNGGVLPTAEELEALELDEQATDFETEAEAEADAAQAAE